MRSCRCALAAGLLSLVARTEQSAAAKTDFPRPEIEAAWSEIGEAAKHSTSEVLETIEPISGERTSNEWISKFSGDKWLIHRKGRQDSREDVYCQNDKYGFHLMRPSEESNWMILHAADSVDIDPMSFGVFETRTPYLHVGPVSVPTMVGDDGFEVLRAEGHPESGIVEVEFKNSSKARTNGMLLSKGVIQIDTNRKWVVAKYDVTALDSSNRSYSWQQTNEYAASQPGSPILRKTESRLVDAAGGVGTTTKEFRDYKFGDTSPDEFTLTYYGLPELGSISQPGAIANRAMLFLTGLAILFFAFALLLRRGRAAA